MPYPLRTPRLRIDPLRHEDAAAFAAYRRHPEVARYQSWSPAFSDEDGEALIAGQPEEDLPRPRRWLQLALRDAEAGTLYGDVAIHTMPDQPDTYELGVTLAAGAQGRGIASEGVRRVLAFLFTEKRAHRVVAFCDSRNEPVTRLLRAVGMRQESHQVDADFFKDEWTTLDGYAILAREYEGAA